MSAPAAPGERWSERLGRGLPLWIAAALLATVAPDGVLLVVPTLGVLLVGALWGRLRLGRLGEALLMLAGAALALPLTRLLIPSEADDGRLPALWSGIACAALTCAAVRVMLDPRRAPLGGARTTYLLGLLSICACGEIRLGPPYTVAAATYLLLSLLALRAEDQTRLSWGRLSRREQALSLFLPILATLLGWAVVVPLVPLQRILLHRINLAEMSGHEKARFTERLQLGSLRDMLESDEIVLRVYDLHLHLPVAGSPAGGPATTATGGPAGDPAGDPIDYLRGVAYDHYENGRWKRRPTHAVRLAAAAGPAGQATVEIRRVSGDPDRLFLPLRLAALGTEDGVALHDGLGALRSQPGAGGRFWLREGPRTVAPLPPPGPQDLQVPPALTKPLFALAAEWTAGAATAEQKLSLLEHRLTSGYAYSLHFQRQGARDPVLEFLLEQKQGHCEYFASALALLARSVGIPARVVGGYRVSERNPLGGYHLVRERNAHTWVEASLPDRPERGWLTYDPTPAGPDNTPHDSSLLAALRELIATSLGAAWRFVTGRRRGELYALAAAFAALLIAIRWLRSRRQGAALPAQVPYGEPLPGYLQLEKALAARGLSRPPWEALEDFAARLADGNNNDNKDTAALIARYAALRYGGQGDAGALSAELSRHAARLTGIDSWP